MSNTWQENDVVVTNYRTIVQSQEESCLMGYEEAIKMVIDVCRSMYTEYDKETLKELEQRIV
jgi:hypothetical protein